MEIETSGELYFEYVAELNKIEDVVTKKPITKKTSERLFKKLQLVQKKICQFEKTSGKIDVFAKSLIKKLQLRAITLYGTIEDKFYKSQINIIKENVLLLKIKLTYKNFKAILQIKNSLESQIKTLLESYAPALKDRRVVVIATTTISQAEKLLYGKEDHNVFSKTNLEETEEIIEEFGAYFEENDQKKLRREWGFLTPKQQKLFLKYLNPHDVDLFLQTVEQGSEEVFCAFG
jgi:hypothetical protein